MSGLEYIGRKIKELSSEAVEKWAGSIGEFPSDLKASEMNIFIHIGELFINRNEQNESNLISFIDDFGLKLIFFQVPLERSIHFIYLTRRSIMEFLEQEVRENHLSVDHFFEALKTLEYFYQLISKTLVNRYNKELSCTKFALDESNHDLKITLRQLADLRTALNEATIFSITDHSDRISYVNDMFCNLYKYTREELIGKKHDIFFSNFHPSSFFQNIWETLQRGEAWKGEILNQAKDGTKIWLDTTFVPFIDANGEHYQHIAIQYDITEQKKAEETLRTTEKLSMIGELAAGIAHEIRNPLTAVRGFVQLLTEAGNGKEYSNIILEEIERINFIVNEFMIFARPHAVYYSECEVKSILDSVIKFLEPEAILNNVTIEAAFPPEKIALRGERNQLKQVFVNLIKNAIEAMPSGGKIHTSIETTKDHITVTIKDNGAGMAEEQVKRLGEPFYTTKTTGNGLGLMVSYKIIENHKGTIEVKSKPNEGTSFMITFQK